MNENGYASWIAGGIIVAIFSLIPYGLWGGTAAMKTVAVLLGASAVIIAFCTRGGNRFKPGQAETAMIKSLLFRGGQLSVGILLGWAGVIFVCLMVRRV
jgi:hypothetical protein